MEEPRRRTLQDVADAAGLSKSATSYALRGLRGSSETRARVHGIAARLGYTVDPLARALAGGRSTDVVIVASLGDLWQQDLAVMLGRALAGLSLHATIADVDASPGREEAVLRSLDSRQVGGLVTVPVDPSASYWAEVPESIRVVSIGDALVRRPRASSVLFDNADGIRTALAHLAGLGHRRVAVLASSLPETPGRPAELLATGIGRELGLEVVVSASRASVADAADQADALLAASPRPSALLCLSDSIAFGAYTAARRAGLSVPGDLSVLGYDDSAMAPLVDPPLSTFGWDEQAIVDAAVEALAREPGADDIGHDDTGRDDTEDGDAAGDAAGGSAGDAAGDASVAPARVFSPEIVLRGSTAAPRG